jgi:Protein of unknown function (DUF3047)
MIFSMAVLLVALAAGDGGAVPVSAPAHRVVIPPRDFTVFKEDSGPVNYYSVGEDGETPILRAVYRPGLGNVVMNARVPEAARQAVRSVSWRWRAHALPREANDCGPGASDAAASVFLAFKAGLKLMVIKYVWSTEGTVGTSCQSNRGWFFDRDTTLVQVGGPMDVWTTHTVDPRREFVKHYGGKLEDVPDFVAIGVMTDGDNSQSPSEADYADFVVEW